MSRDAKRGAPTVRAVADGNPTNMRHCGLEGCRGSYYARGLCYRHYLQWWEAGKPDEFTPKKGRITGRQKLPPRFTVFTG